MNAFSHRASLGPARTLAAAVAALWAGLALAAPPAPRWIGYRGPDSSGVFPDSRPPADCDMTTGRNIRWRAPMPNWGHACPLVVKDRAYVLSEPGWKHDWPVLTCVEIASGRVLWEREINHLPATGLSAERQAEVAKQVREFHAEWRKLYTIFAETVGQGDQEAAKSRFKELGREFGGHRGGGYGQLRSLKPRPSLRIKEAGLRDDVWRHACGLASDEIGSAFATPVSDGEHIYVVCSRSAAASYDRDGTLRWMAFVPFPPELSGYNESNGRSPILYRDPSSAGPGLMISDHSGHTVALDMATGQVRWQAKTFGGGIATPAIVTVNGTDVLLTEGHQGKGGGFHALRLPDGVPLRLAPGPSASTGETQESLIAPDTATGDGVLPTPKAPKLGGWGPAGNAILVNPDHRDVAYFSSGCHTDFQGKAPDNPDTPLWSGLPVAVRFALEPSTNAAQPGGTLKATVLWEGSRTEVRSEIPMVCHSNRLYIGSTVVEALTGKVLGGGRGQKTVVPPTRHLLLIAGDRLYGLSGHAGLCDRPPDAGKPVATLTCYSLDGRQLGSSPLTMAPVEGEKLAQVRSQVGWDRWGFGYGMPFTIAGDCLYLRSSDELVCVGSK